MVASTALFPKWDARRFRPSLDPRSIVTPLGAQYCRRIACPPHVTSLNLPSFESADRFANLCDVMKSFFSPSFFVYSRDLFFCRGVDQTSADKTVAAYFTRPQLVGSPPASNAHLDAHCHVKQPPPSSSAIDHRRLVPTRYYLVRSRVLPPPVLARNLAECPVPCAAAVLLVS